MIRHKKWDNAEPVLASALCREVHILGITLCTGQGRGMRPGRLNAHQRPLICCTQTQTRPTQHSLTAPGRKLVDSQVQQESRLWWWGRHRGFEKRLVARQVCWCCPEPSMWCVASSIQQIAQAKPASRRSPVTGPHSKSAPRSIVRKIQVPHC